MTDETLIEGKNGAPMEHLRGNESISPKRGPNVQEGRLRGSINATLRMIFL